MNKRHEKNAARYTYQMARDSVVSVIKEKDPKHPNKQRLKYPLKGVSVFKSIRRSPISTS